MPWSDWITDIERRTIELTKRPEFKAFLYDNPNGPNFNKISSISSMGWFDKVEDIPTQENYGESHTLELHAMWNASVGTDESKLLNTAAWGLNGSLQEVQITSRPTLIDPNAPWEAEISFQVNRHTRTYDSTLHTWNWYPDPDAGLWSANPMPDWINYLIRQGGWGVDIFGEDNDINKAAWEYEPGHTEGPQFISLQLVGISGTVLGRWSNQHNLGNYYDTTAYPHYGYAEGREDLHLVHNSFGWPSEDHLAMFGTNAWVYRHPWFAPDSSSNFFRLYDGLLEDPIGLRTNDEVIEHTRLYPSSQVFTDAIIPSDFINSEGAITFMGTPAGWRSDDLLTIGPALPTFTHKVMSPYVVSPMGFTAAGLQAGWNWGWVKEHPTETEQMLLDAWEQNHISLKALVPPYRYWIPSFPTPAPTPPPPSAAIPLRLIQRDAQQVKEAPRAEPGSYW